MKSDTQTPSNVASGHERMLVLTAGFCIYPTLKGATGYSSDGIAFPKVDSVPHRPMMTIPLGCVDEIEGQLPAALDGNALVVELDGLSAAFEVEAGMSEIAALQATESGRFPGPVEEQTLDFNLVADSHTFFRGLSIPKQWRGSNRLQASYTFLPGIIGGIPDKGTNAFEYRWGFSAEEQAMPRRKTNVTVHASHDLRSRRLAFRRVGTDDRIGTIVVRPGKDDVVLALLTNGWGGAGIRYGEREAMAVNLSHVEAMLQFCDRVPGQSTQVDFGVKTEVAGHARYSGAPLLAAGVVLEPIVDRLRDVTMLYNSDLSCSGRRMRMD